MDNKKIGNFIAELRKSKNMTQKELAEKLNVTDKAVSKWERGMGYPEITTAPLLAELLGVSLSELLMGQHIDEHQKKDETAVTVNTDDIASGAIEYAQQSYKQKASRINFIAFIAMSIAFLIALFVSCLCNFIINGKFDWSLYVLGSEVTAWLIAAPLFLLEKHRFAVSMLGLTVSIMPLLLLIEYLCPVKGWVIPLALPIVIISLVILWVSVILFVYTKLRRLYLLSLEFVFAAVLNLIFNSFVSTYLHSSSLLRDNISVPIIAISCIFVAAVLFVIGFSRGKKMA